VAFVVSRPFGSQKVMVSTGNAVTGTDSLRIKVMKIRSFVKIFAFSLVLFIVIAPLRRYGGGFPVSSLVGFVLAVYLTMYCLYRYEKHLNTGLILLALMIGVWFLNIPVRILDFNGSLLSLPDPLMHSLGVVCGALYWRMKRPLNFAALVLCSVVPVFMYFQGYDYWVQKLNYGTFTGSVTYEQPANFEAFDKNGKLISDADLRDKIVLVDFWHTSCRVCFQKFPHLQALYDKYKDDPSVLIFAVDKPIDGDKTGQAFSMIEERGYTFPVVIPTDKELPEKFGVFAYPRTFIITDKTIVFDGDSKFAEGKIEQLRSSFQ
jgi:thiol-disulfide isomerase/thioredoxin